MDRRVHRALDGELAETALSQVEREELAAVRTALDGALAHLDAEPAPDVADSVMWRVRGLEPEPAPPRVAAAPGILAGLLGTARWLLTPQPVRLRPVAALGLVAFVALSAALFRSEPQPPSAADVGQVHLLVQFRLSAENAQQVALVGNFSGWEGQPLEEVSPGVWTTTVSLEPGLYDYAFVIDGERWQLDPLAPAVADGFGGANSRIAVLAPEAQGL